MRFGDYVADEVPSESKQHDTSSRSSPFRKVHFGMDDELPSESQQQDGSSNEKSKSIQQVTIPNTKKVNIEVLDNHKDVSKCENTSLVEGSTKPMLYVSILS